MPAARFPILQDIPSYSRFLTVSEVDTLLQSIRDLPGVHTHAIGRTVNGEDLLMLEVGSGDRTALVIGVPHSDEPLGSLLTTYFVRWLATHPQANHFGWRWLVIPILEWRGMRLNEGWFNRPDSLAAVAKASFREPTEEQYEWTFPASYEDYQWTRSRPETLAVKRVLEREKPALLCGLHHSGFTNAYYYFSHHFPEVYGPLRKFVAPLRIPLSDTSPDVPFGRMLHPGFYQMYGLKDYLDYYATTSPALIKTIQRGACSDEWYQKEIGSGFSFNCEVPMYLSLLMQDKNPSSANHQKMQEARYKTKMARARYAKRILNRLAGHADLADGMLYEMAKKHLDSEWRYLEHEKELLTAPPKKEGKLTRGEVLEGELLADLSDLFLLGHLWRVAESICIKGGMGSLCRVMDSVNLEIISLAKSVQKRGQFYQVPLRTAVKMQLGSLLIIAEALRTKSDPEFLSL
ncbi:MAG TPA: hypothetical protein ENN54_01920 [Thermoplasmatales archaeon]|nr:hypothetical protein [Thermoplasmatales archaeon]